MPARILNQNLIIIALIVIFSIVNPVKQIMYATNAKIRFLLLMAYVYVHQDIIYIMVAVYSAMSLIVHFVNKLMFVIHVIQLIIKRMQVYA